MFYWHFLTFIGLTLARKTKGLSLWMLFLKQKKNFFLHSTFMFIDFLQRTSVWARRTPAQFGLLGFDKGWLYFFFSLGCSSGKATETRRETQSSQLDGSLHETRSIRIRFNPTTTGGRVLRCARWACRSRLEMRRCRWRSCSGQPNPTQPNLT